MLYLLYLICLLSILPAVAFAIYARVITELAVSGSLWGLIKTAANIIFNFVLKPVGDVWPLLLALTAIIALIAAGGFAATRPYAFGLVAVAGLIAVGYSVFAVSPIGSLSGLVFFLPSIVGSLFAAFQVYKLVR